MIFKYLVSKAQKQRIRAMTKQKEKVDLAAQNEDKES